MDQATPPQTPIRKHRPAAMIGGIVGLLLIVALVAYQFAMTPARPDVANATQQQIVTYVSDPRGFNKLEQVEQERFLKAWKEKLDASPAAKTDLRTCIENMSTADRKQFADVLAHYFKQVFMSNARQFARITDPTEKSQFIRRKLAEGQDQFLSMKDLVIAFKNDFGKTDDFQQWAIENTTPDERALAEPYIDAIKRVSVQVKKENGAPPPHAGNKKK